MKTFLIIALAFLLPVIAWSQQNMLSLGAGYSFASTESGASLSGWRINALYEGVSANGKLLHGFSLGYISVSGQVTSPITEDISLSTIPSYYAPKLLLGNSEKFKPYVRLAIGSHFTNLKRTTSVSEIKGSDFGFYGGGGAGFHLIMKNDFFLNTEYEWAWLSNAYYTDAGISTASVAFGKKF